MIRHHVVGCGRWGTWLARRMSAVGHPPTSLCNRTAGAADELGAELGIPTRPWDRFPADMSGDDCIWLTLSDDALSAAHALLLARGSRALAVQASGVQPLPETTYPTATVWPILSVSTAREPDWSLMTCVVEAGTRERAERVHRLVNELIVPGRILIADAERRARLHLGAVLTQNFTNYLWSLAEDQLGPELLTALEPLARAHLDALREGATPDHLQTGPAARGDEQTLRRHEQLLRDQSEALEIYRHLSRAIRARHQRN